MDFAVVFSQVADLFIRLCSVEVAVFGVTFYVGTLYLYCAFVIVVLLFLKGMSD